uniref:Tyr p 6 allergen n=1 Tax=Tyrophagus putrescentiae TaxID=59818 RepID=A0A977TJM4_TYRPU|nr:Tyr p 6 allergen [Tyrophagus putrescentiae]
MALKLLVLAALVLAAQARFPKSLQARWGFLDTLDDSTRVVGGSEAKQAEAPFQISLQKDYIILKSHICGGSLIAPRTVVTAAHCTDGSQANSLVVRMGTNKRSQPGQGVPDQKTSKIIQHPNYDSNTIQNDISLLILPKAVSPASNVAMIELETQDLVGGEDVKVFGWGLTDGNNQNSIPENLQVGNLKIVSRADCQAKWGEVNAIHEGMICALAPSTQACNGDSGGPLVSANNKLTGIVSWGPSKCPPGEYMAVFTLPKYYQDWIKANWVQ